MAVVDLDAYRRARVAAEAVNVGTNSGFRRAPKARAEPRRTPPPSRRPGVVTQLTTPTRATALPSSRPLAAPPPPCSAPVDPLPALTAEQCLEVLCRDRDRRKTTAVLGFTTLVVGIFAFANMLMATSNAPTAAYDSVAHVVGVP